MKARLTIWSQLVTTFVALLPYSPQLEGRVTHSNWPDVKSSFCQAKFGVLLAQDIEFFVGMALDPGLQRVDLFQHRESLCCQPCARDDYKL
jgi:hypothetical protein